MVARHHGITTRFGGFLDSTLDRLVDMALLVGVAVHFAASGDAPHVLLAGAALITSVLVSYAQARAELVVPDFRVGLFERAERVVVLALGALFGLAGARALDRHAGKRDHGGAALLEGLSGDGADRRQRARRSAGAWLTMTEKTNPNAASRWSTGAPAAADADTEAPPAASPPPREEPARDPGEALPPVDFAGFVLSLATSALYHMGFVGDPERDQPAPAPDLPLARQTIDTLEMLQLKTRGNLDSEEGRLLEGVLYELHLRYVEVSK